MQKSMFVAAILMLVLPSGILSDRQAMAQGSGSSRVAPPPSSQSRRSNPAVPTTPRPPTATEFAASFWNYLNNPKKPYRQWGTPGKGKRQGGTQASGGAGQAEKFHPHVGQTYLNDVANQNLQQMPLGSVLVREEYAADGQTLAHITVMYRAKTADPKNANWYWIMYRPDGSVATASPEQGGRPLAGRIQSCTQCHQQAGGSDFVFLNDRPIPGSPPGSPPGSGQTSPSGRAPGVPQSNPSGSGARR